MRDMEEAALTIGRRLSWLLTVPWFLPTGGPIAMRSLRLMEIAVRVMGNFVTDEDTDLHTPTVSRLAGLVLIDVLATSVAMALGADHLHNLSTMKEALAQFRSNESETKTDPDIDRPAASVVRIQEEQ